MAKQTLLHRIFAGSYKDLETIFKGEEKSNLNYG
jgi:hypothetical protein